MDAFYASVELLRYPQLKGLPVVIGGGRRRVDDALREAHGEVPLGQIPLSEFPVLSDYTGRGVITTATYAARQFGVGSAMGMMKAARLCPHAIVLPVDFAQYRHYPARFKRHHHRHCAADGKPGRGRGVHRLHRCTRRVSARVAGCWRG